MTADLTIRPVAEREAPDASSLAARAPHVRKTADAAQKFEAFVLQTFIQEMMPETQESVFGDGISGDFWKSMMSEKIADQVAERGGLGLAKMVRTGPTVPMRPAGFNPLDVLGSVSGLNGVVHELDATPSSGE